MAGFLGKLKSIFGEEDEIEDDLYDSEGRDALDRKVEERRQQQANAKRDKLQSSPVSEVTMRGGSPKSSNPGAKRTSFNAPDATAGRRSSFSSQDTYQERKDYHFESYSAGDDGYRSAPQERPRSYEPEREYNSGGYKQNASQDVSRTGMSGAIQIVVQQYEDCLTVSDAVNRGEIVICNFKSVDVETAQCMLSFLQGACYIMDGNFNQFDDYIFILSPKERPLEGHIIRDIAASTTMTTL